MYDRASGKLLLTGEEIYCMTEVKFIKLAVSIFTYFQITWKCCQHTS